MGYVGRFAPSPTGKLHLGTLTAAVASFLHARQASGEWLLRIEDIDPPRELAGSAEAILEALEKLDLHWDRKVIFQSTRRAEFYAAAAGLFANGSAYYCRCSRRQLRGLPDPGIYPGTCRERGLPPDDAALRIRVDKTRIDFVDGVCGKQRYSMESDVGDFIIVRRDELPAYHLAVVIDDANQGVTDIVRGADLLPSTPQHIFLQGALGLPIPRYWHIPLVTDASGLKLSKSFGASPIDANEPGRTAVQALEQLGLHVPVELRGARPAELWAWAIQTFRIERLGVTPAAPAT